MTSFTELGIPDNLIKTLESQGISQPFPIQEQGIPAVLSRKDVLGIAETGSGKTVSYVLPILLHLQKQNLVNNRSADVLVLVPTRELAVQVQSVFKSFVPALSTPLKSMAVYGGVSINPQMKNLNGVNILIATPGRLLELIENNAIGLSKITTLVLDEADKMLNLGFKDEMDRIFKFLPGKRQNLLFSATLSKEVTNMTGLLLTDPIVINIKPGSDDEVLINQLGYFVSEEKKGPLLRFLIRQNNLQQVLVFTSSTHKADRVAEKLFKNGIDALSIHSKKSQGARTEALSDFKQGHIRVLVTTDLLARGIDIEFLPCVINYELPRSPKDYIHRIGRTGRAKSPGEAISFVTPTDEHHFRVIQKKMGKVATMIDADGLDLAGS